MLCANQNKFCFAENANKVLTNELRQYRKTQCTVTSATLLHTLLGTVRGEISIFVSHKKVK